MLAVACMQGIQKVVDASPIVKPAHSPQSQRANTTVPFRPPTVAAPARSSMAEYMADLKLRLEAQAKESPHIVRDLEARKAAEEERLRKECDCDYCRIHLAKGRPPRRGDDYPKWHVLPPCPRITASLFF